MSTPIHSHEHVLTLRFADRSSTPQQEGSLPTAFPASRVVSDTYSGRSLGMYCECEGEQQQKNGKKKKKKKKKNGVEKKKWRPAALSSNTPFKTPSITINTVVKVNI